MTPEQIAESEKIRSGFPFLISSLFITIVFFVVCVTPEGNARCHVEPYHPNLSWKRALAAVVGAALALLALPLQSALVYGVGNWLMWRGKTAGAMLTGFYIVVMFSVRLTPGIEYLSMGLWVLAALLIVFGGYLLIYELFTR